MPKATIKSKEEKIKEEFQVDIKELKENQKLLMDKLEKERLEKEKLEKEKLEKQNNIDEETETKSIKPKVVDMINKLRSTPIISVPSAPIINVSTTLSDKDKDKDKDKEKDNEGNIACPNCHVGHVHQLRPEKTKDEDGTEYVSMNYKCTGDKCGMEYVMVPKDSDYKCIGCGAAIKRPADPKSMGGCPFCHNTRAIKFDWGKLWNVSKKK